MWSRRSQRISLLRNELATDLWSSPSGVFLAGLQKKRGTGPFFFVVIVQSASVGDAAYRASDAHPVAAAGQVVRVGAQLPLHEIASAICADCGAPV